MKKEFIMDGNRVRACSSNLAKMTILEYVKYIDKADLLKEILAGYAKGIKDIFIGIAFIIADTFFSILYIPIQIYRAHLAIKKAKEDVARQKQYSN